MSTDKEITAELVGGPFCGAFIAVLSPTAKVFVSDCIGGCSVEYLYHRTKRTSVVGFPIYRYDHKRVLSKVGGCDG